ncbi:MAG: hypothetical protein U0174_07625 [Polyangiaceae bacterium]
MRRLFTSFAVLSLTFGCGSSAAEVDAGAADAGPDPDAKPSSDSGFPVDGGVSSDAKASGFVVFVTKAVFVGNVGALSQADAACQQFAAAAGFGGNFRAWLSTDTSDAISRVPDGAGPWRTPAGAVAFKTKAQWAGYPDVDLSINELGQQTENGGLFWTGTDVGGKAAGAAPHPNCKNWSIASAGGVGAAGNGRIKQDNQAQSWTNGFGNRCNEPAALLCFQYQ